MHLASTSSVNRTSVFNVTLIVLAIAAGVICFGDALYQLTERWSQQEQYSYGYLVPVVALWLIWSRMELVRENIGQSSFLGVIVIAVAIIIGALGELSAIFIFSQLAFVLSLMGIALAAGGIPLLRVTLIPIAYLLFAIPLPYFIDAKLTLELQLISSELGVFFIRLFQIPVYLEGNIIDMGAYKLQVVEACSGLRYLYPLLSLSFLVAYMLRGALWQRIFLFLSSIPIAILMNGFRIGIVGLLVDRFGLKSAEGALHLFEGWLIFVGCVGLLAAEMALLAKVTNISFSDVFRLSEKTKGTYRQSVGAMKQSIVPLLGCFLLLCVGAIAFSLVSGRQEILPARNRFASFPMQFQTWSGKPLQLDWGTEQALKLDDYILADYSRGAGPAVNIYVAYYASQRKNESPHSPVVCLPGSGWLITRFERKSFYSGGINHPFNRVIIQNGSRLNLVYYWFEERGSSVADEYFAKWQLLTDSIRSNRSDGALVRLTTEIESEDEADARLLSFMHVAMPELWSNFLPAAPRLTPSPDSFSAGQS